MSIRSTATYSPEEGKVGSSFDLELDTEFVGLGAATTHRIYFRKPGQAAEYKEATVFDATWLRAAFEPDDIDRVMDLRTWTYARGTGTIVWKGRTFIIPIVAEDR